MKAGLTSVAAGVAGLTLASRLLGLPDDRRCNYLLSFGYPANPAELAAPNKRGGRKPLDTVVHEERW